MTSHYALELVDVVKRFGDHAAVNNLSFTVETGTVVALLGPNGAGKTTTIEMCEGFQQPTSGKISVLGINPVTDPNQVRAKVGIMLQDSGSYSGIKVEEMLRLSASYNKDPLDPAWLLQLFGLENARNTTYRRLSGGQKQRLNLAVALISRPQLVFVDEPTAGMDAQSRILVWNLIKALRNDGVTVILTTHLMDEAQALADKVLILDRGQLAAEGSPAELQAATTTAIHFETDKDVDLTAPQWREFDITSMRPRTYVVRAVPTPEIVEKLARNAAAERILITHLDTHARSLEDVFLDITGHTLRS
ncbi:MAG: ABC transporter ATP-binding protein [Corynebacterium sp.]|nr:ABC transporter ATP-binding protein [Corynebacterium sp.]